jgi:hypothetical protein
MYNFESKTCPFRRRFVDAVNYFYRHHMRCRLVAELPLPAAAREVIAEVWTLGVVQGGGAHFRSENTAKLGDLATT